MQGLKWSASVRIPITHASLDDCQNIKTCLIQLHAFESNCKYGISSLIGWAFSRLLTDSGENAPLPKICHTYPTIMKIGILYLKNIQKIYKSVIHPLSSAGITIFPRKSATLLISRNTDLDWILVHHFNFFNLFWILEGCFN